MKYDYESLTVLAAVVREGSFEAASKNLNVTQSAVSQRIKALEEKVGGLLVIRGRPCIPTDLGRHLCQHVEQINLLQFDLSERLSVLVSEGAGDKVSVRIGVNNDSLATWFPAALRRAANELNVLFDIVPDDQEHTEASLVSGDVLAVITSSDNPPPGCRMIALGAMDYIAVATPKFYNDNFADGVTLETLKDTDCIAFDRKDTIQDQWMRICFGQSEKVRCHFVPSYDGYVACCLNSAGWGLVPSFAAERHLREGTLVELIKGKSVKISLNWQSSTLSSDLLRRLGDIVFAEASKQLNRSGLKEG